MTKRKIAYSKLTFILSILGFIGSLGFYFGVLRQVYSEPNETESQLIEIQKENENLKIQVNTLTKVVNDCKDEK
jgi:cell division protein FtsB